jgi:type I restriction enzyme, S subunit
MAAIFWEKFDQFVDSPESIARIRALIIDLAVAGRLVPNDPTEQPVGLEMSGFSLSRTYVPANWRVGTVGDVLTFEYGDNLPATHRDSSGEFPVYGSNGVVGTHSKYLCREPAIIVGRKGSAGALNMSAGPSWTTDVAYFVRPPKEIELRFAYYLLESLRLEELGKGIKPGLSRKEVYAIPVAIPPFMEQGRIVSRIDELLGLCDRLEAQHKEKNALHAVLTRSAVTRFNNDPTSSNLKFVFHDSYSVSPTQLRRTILSLAVRGKLLTQNSDDEPAKELLKRIAERRKALLDAGYPNRNESMTQAKKQSEQSSLGSLSPLPEGWVCSTLLEASLLIVDCHNKTAPYVPSGVRLLRTTNIRKGRLNLSEPKFVSETTYERWSSRCKPQPGDLLITREAPMGEVCIIPEGMTVCMGQRMMLIRLVPEIMNKQFVLYSLMDPDLMDRVQDKPVGATVQHLRVGGVETLLMPIPPLAEQARIVAKVDQLMALVDRLEEQCTTSQVKSNQLFDALVHEVLHPKTETMGPADTMSKIASQRSVVGCHAIKLLGSNPHFGRTMLMKVFYLSEAHCGIAQHWQPLRQAAGPYDPAVEDFELRGIRLSWFSVSKKTLRNGHEMVQYESGSGLKTAISNAASLLGEKKAEFDRLLTLFLNKTTEEAEIIATLFAAWNDLLIDGKSPSDDDIIREVRENWHYKKERFTPTLLTGWLNWLRQQSVIPRGLAPRTRQQLKLGLS